MQARGYSLVEMVIVIAVISILLAVGTIGFNAYARRYRAEAQTRMIYSELQKARGKAAFERRQLQVMMFADRLEVYSSLAGNGAAPSASLSLSSPVVMSSTVKIIVFDGRGLTSDLGSVCLADAGTGSAVDSVVIHKVRTSIGKKDKGDACNSDNITKK